MGPWLNGVVAWWRGGSVAWMIRPCGSFVPWLGGSVDSALWLVARFVQLNLA